LPIQSSSGRSWFHITQPVRGPGHLPQSRKQPRDDETLPARRASRATIEPNRYQDMGGGLPMTRRPGAFTAPGQRPAAEPFRSKSSTRCGVSGTRERPTNSGSAIATHPTSHHKIRRSQPAARASPTCRRPQRSYDDTFKQLFRRLSVDRRSQSVPEYRGSRRPATASHPRSELESNARHGWADVPLPK